MKFDSQEQSNEIRTTGGQSLQQSLQTTKPSRGLFRSKCYCCLLELVENFYREMGFFLTETWVFIQKCNFHGKHSPSVGNPGSWGETKEERKGKGRTSQEAGDGFLC